MPPPIKLYFPNILAKNFALKIFTSVCKFNLVSGEHNIIGGCSKNFSLSGEWHQVLGILKILSIMNLGIVTHLYLLIEKFIILLYTHTHTQNKNREKVEK